MPWIKDWFSGRVACRAVPCMKNRKQCNLLFVDSWAGYVVTTCAHYQSMATLQVLWGSAYKGWEFVLFTCGRFVMAAGFVFFATSQVMLRIKTTGNTSSACSRQLSGQHDTFFLFNIVTMPKDNTAGKEAVVRWCDEGCYHVACRLSHCVLA